MEKPATLVVLGGLVVLGTSLGIAGLQIAELDAALREFMRTQRRMMPVQYFEEVVTRTSDGAKVTVHTDREKLADGSWEPVTTWTARHLAAVNAMRDS